MRTHSVTGGQWCAAITLLLALPVAALAQRKPVPAADLAKYDVNRNGRLDADEAATRNADLARVTRSNAGEETVVLSPFEVVSEDRGYHATNTMSGTRLNTKLEDLAASISVITKEQMADFALLDANDIFLYEAGTEGIGNYTAFEFDRNGAPIDSTSLEPGSANRMRGLSSANTARGNFETSGRVPIDPINIDAVEISR